MLLISIYLFRDDNWARDKGMDCFLSVGKGSDKKPMFVELHYKQCADEEKNVILVGKGKKILLIVMQRCFFVVLFSFCSIIISEDRICKDRGLCMLYSVSEIKHHAHFQLDQF